MKRLFFLLSLFLFVALGVQAQRKLPSKSKEQKAVEKRKGRRENSNEESPTELRWNPRKLSAKSKGYPEVSAWHAGTAGIIASDGAEINLFYPTRVGFSRRTEWLFRVAEEPFLPNIGMKHAWWNNKRFFFSTEHAFYYLWPGLKMLQNSGYKNLIADSVRLPHGVAMRHEIIFSWLMNPSEWGCPNPPPERILSFRGGAELYAGKTSVPPFDYGHALYHSQVLGGKVLYYGGLQFDSYFNHRFHYSINGLYYNVDLKEDYAAEANVRFTCYVSLRFGISLVGKAAYIHIDNRTKWSGVPLLDFTYLIKPSRSTIKHGLYKNNKKRR